MLPGGGPRKTDHLASFDPSFQFVWKFFPLKTDERVLGEGAVAVGEMPHWLEPEFCNVRTSGLHLSQTPCSLGTCMGFLGAPYSDTGTVGH